MKRTMVGGLVLGIAVTMVACSSASVCTEEGSSALASAAQALEPEGSCIGSAESCGSFSGLGCTQEGCSVDIGRYDDPSDDRCRGYPVSCTSRTSKSRCLDVKGCSWKVSGGASSGSGQSGSSSGSAPGSNAQASSPCGSSAASSAPPGSAASSSAPAGSSSPGTPAPADPSGAPAPSSSSSGSPSPTPTPTPTPTSSGSTPSPGPTPPGSADAGAPPPDSGSGAGGGPPPPVPPGR